VSLTLHHQADTHDLQCLLLLNAFGVGDESDSDSGDNDVPEDRSSNGREMPSNLEQPPRKESAHRFDDSGGSDFDDLDDSVASDRLGVDFNEPRRARSVGNAASAGDGSDADDLSTDLDASSVDIDSDEDSNGNEAEHIRRTKPGPKDLQVPDFGDDLHPDIESLSFDSEDLQ